MAKLKEGQIDEVSKEMRKIIAEMDMTEEEYYSTGGSFTPFNVDEHIKKECEKDPEFAKFWEAKRLEDELRNAITEERKKQNLTQEELAKKAHLTQQQLSRFEVGRNNTSSPSLSTISKLLSALNLDIKFVPTRK